ncbi:MULTISPECIES: hypothetical protein, partial [Pseudomonas]|uniref:hypothetical protein n=1 Tax=Pseudomonas TaxID=286 RepID=UPI00300529EA
MKHFNEWRHPIFSSLLRFPVWREYRERRNKIMIYKEFIATASFVCLYRPAFRLPSVECELKWTGNSVSKGI